MGTIAFPDSALIVVAEDALTLPFPPTEVNVGLVPEWMLSGEIPDELQLEIWAGSLPATNTITDGELLGGVPHVILGGATVAVDSVDETTDEIEIVGHGLTTGDGTFTFTSDDTLPDGVVAGTEYYAIVTGVDTFKLATSRANALTGVAVDIVDQGAGTHTWTLDDEPTRVFWHSYGDLPAIPLGAQRAYTVRIQHDPGVIAYALVGTLAASDPEFVSATLRPLVEHR